MNIFLDELRLTPCKLESPTAATVANTTQKMPPMIGSGMVMNAAPTFPNNENKIINNPAAWITRRLPTLVTLMAPMFSEYEVVPLPVPKMPAKTHPTPSTKIPRLSACFGGGFAPGKI